MTLRLKTCRTGLRCYRAYRGPEATMLHLAPVRALDVLRNIRQGVAWRLSGPRCAAGQGTWRR